MKLITRTLLICLLSACGVKGTSKSAQTISRQIEEYRSAFIEEAKDRGVAFRVPEESVEVRLGDFGDANAWGVCVRPVDPEAGNAQPKVMIKPEVWVRLTDLQRRALAYHEFAHCYLYKDHKNDRAGHCPVSLMSATLPSEGCLFENWEEYEDGIFDS